MTLGDGFLFAKEEGEGDISSDQLLAEQSVLPLHNHRNPGGSGEGLCILKHGTDLPDKVYTCFLIKIIITRHNKS